ncbi:hypothetical protein F3Y22_tig00110450pilonHSYRG01021 [Hibiscus syriacus]|uniref:Uncharacterized protein n=1 Tax=Hibiscus syriacus TaxID=106335 RepID=A0A6A3AKH2_HIBSY|nr:hypothetical protein F3Y22_tig00110450pilonHSYRG01021 [Hibiscus syriacus]
MGTKFSSPMGGLSSLEDQVHTMIGKSLSFKDESVKTMLQSLSFKKIASDQEGMEPKGLEESSSFIETERCMKPSNDNIHEKPGSNIAKNGGRRYQAALKLQKVYKSFRIRRQLADCAVVAEQRWWKLLDFAELKGRSICFFEIEKQETAVSLWSRARTRAAEVGKGLSKDEKLESLLFCIGSRLILGIVMVIICNFAMPHGFIEKVNSLFSIGLISETGGKSVLKSALSRSFNSNASNILAERDSFKVVIRNGMFVCKHSEQVQDTTGGPRDANWIFVLSAFKTLYLEMKKKGTFQHSSFLAGGATLSTGRLVVENGVLKAIWPHSGRSLNRREFPRVRLISSRDHHVDLTNVKAKKKMKAQSSLRQQIMKTQLKPTLILKRDSDATPTAIESMSRWSRGFLSKIRGLETPARDDGKTDGSETTDGDSEISEECLSEEEFLCTKTNLFGEDDAQEEDEKSIPKEKIMRRLDSHKEAKSYQVADHLSSKWSSGAGPRISCMRDYTSELQYRVLGQAHCHCISP